MTTTVTKSIGATGRDYTTIAAFLAAIPADLIAADQAWVGELYNDAEFAVAAKVTLGAKTTSAACYIKLCPAAGQGFAHNANKLTNALRYNPANGVAITSSVDWDDAFDLTGAADVIVEGIQFKFTASYWTNGIKVGGSRAQVRGNILTSTGRGKPLVACNSDEIVVNNVLIYEGGCEQAVYLGWAAAKAYNNTIYVATPSGVAFEGYSTTVAKNNLFIGVSSIGSVATSSYSATTAAAWGGTNNLLSIVGANQVQSLTSGSLDLRVKAGADVIDAGSPIAGITTDILGQTRSATTPTIGAMEYIAAGGGNSPPTFPGPNIGNQTGTVGTALTSNNVSGKFSDTDALTFSAVGSWPPGVTVSSAGVISGTPTTAGTYASLKVRATDTAAQTVDSDTFGFTISAASSVSISATTEDAVGNISAKPAPKASIAATTASLVSAWTASSGSSSVAIAATTTSASGSITAVGDTSSATFTSEQLYDHAGNLLASVSLTFVRLYNDTTGALVLTKTGLTTDSNGRFSFTDAAMTPGTYYRIDWQTDAGSRRMPRKAAI